MDADSGSFDLAPYRGVTSVNLAPDDSVMPMLLAALAIAFAAFCVWLVVRIVNRRERWAKRTAVALLIGVLLAYPLSFGPACWICARPYNWKMTGVEPPRLSEIYIPIGWMMVRFELLSEPINSYGSFGMPREAVVVIPVGEGLYWAIGR